MYKKERYRYSQIRYRRIRTAKNTGFSRRRDCSCFKSHDWRDDPYELYGTHNRLHKPLQGSARQVEAASHPPGTKNRYFSGLKAI
jgi:hypothetical protein